jgi:hypothetical protein
MGTLDEFGLAFAKAALIIASSTGLVVFLGWLAAKADFFN